ncbi:ABC transporter ATP-binding protein [Clostridium beijerinckii]|uniref:ABC transporter ATP-binding protein n=1 Tax=Clostridium beijerinckii TaxID=1520 RepID=UPI00047983AA|nr:ATP-binding cassette domain-containing protein [Clostridium beijerinckii]
MIQVKNVEKEYKIAKYSPGLMGAVKGLFVRDYTIKKVVNNINFNIKKGEMVGYIGGNGAGKSTTIKMLSGILTPSNGEILVNGIVPYKNRKQNAKNIGVVFGQRSQLFWDIPVLESFDLLKHIYEIPHHVYNENLNYMIETIGIKRLLGRAVRQLSLGERMLVELAASFLHDPTIVYLDEPTIGLDVFVKKKIRQFIKDINRIKKTTIMLTTHDMQDIEEICNRIIIIDRGEIIYDGDLELIKQRFGGKRTIHFKLQDSNVFSLPKELLNYVSVDCSAELNKVSLSFENDIIATPDVISIMTKKYPIKDIAIVDLNIETIVQKIYEGGYK